MLAVFFRKSALHSCRNYATLQQAGTISYGTRDSKPTAATKRRLTYDWPISTRVRRPCERISLGLGPNICPNICA